MYAALPALCARYSLRMELADTYQTARVLSVIEREREIKGVGRRGRKTAEAPRRLNCISCSIFGDRRHRQRGTKADFAEINSQATE